MGYCGHSTNVSVGRTTKAELQRGIANLQTEIERLRALNADLLEALKEALSDLNDSAAQYRPKARAAIAKAEARTG